MNLTKIMFTAVAIVSIKGSTIFAQDSGYPIYNPQQNSNFRNPYPYENEKSNHDPYRQDQNGYSKNPYGSDRTGDRFPASSPYVTVNHNLNKTGSKPDIKLFDNIQFPKYGNFRGISLRSGYAAEPTWTDQKFSFKNYEYDYKDSVVFSPWYITYSNMPGYIKANAVTQNIKKQDWGFEPTSQYKWVPNQRSNNYMWDEAVQNIYNAFKGSGNQPFQKLLGSQNSITITLENGDEYQMSNKSLSELLTDMVKSTYTTSFEIVGVTKGYQVTAAQATAQTSKNFPGVAKKDSPDHFLGDFGKIAGAFLGFAKNLEDAKNSKNNVPAPQKGSNNNSIYKNQNINKKDKSGSNNNLGNLLKQFNKSSKNSKQNNSQTFDRVPLNAFNKLFSGVQNSKTNQKKLNTSKKSSNTNQINMMQVYTKHSFKDVWNRNKVVYQIYTLKENRGRFELTDFFVTTASSDIYQPLGKAQRR